jgi:hypothetical protein
MVPRGLSGMQSSIVPQLDMAFSPAILYAEQAARHTRHARRQHSIISIT